MNLESSQSIPLLIPNLLKWVGNEILYKQMIHLENFAYMLLELLHYDTKLNQLDFQTKTSEKQHINNYFNGNLESWDTEMEVLHPHA